MNQMKDEFSGSVRNIEASVTEGTRQELEGQRLRELATIQSRCTRDIEKVDHKRFCTFVIFSI